MTPIIETLYHTYSVSEPSRTILARFDGINPNYTYRFNGFYALDYDVDIDTLPLIGEKVEFVLEDNRAFFLYTWTGTNGKHEYVSELVCFSSSLLQPDRKLILKPKTLTVGLYEYVGRFLTEDFEP